MRIVIAGLLGGIVMFFWGFVAHMFLPLGEIGMKTLPIAKQDVVLAAARDALGEPGIYMVPSFENMDDYGDEAKGTELSARIAANPYAFIVYQPQGVDMVNGMGPFLAREFVTNVLSAILAAFVVSFAAVAFGLRAALVGAMGLFAWLAVHVPYWNWYRFPLDFTLAGLAMQVIGWLLAGLAIAWWLARGERRTL